MTTVLTQEQRDWLRLTMIPGVGSTSFIRLLARFHTPGEVLRASRAGLREVVGPALSDRIAEYGDAVDLDGQERLMEQYGVSLVTLEDPAYPPRLAEIYDPPLALFVRGELYSSDEACIAVVGTRRATPYGLRMAEKFGRELAARGITVVSGMAIGIDSAGHRGALEGGGRTIAVFGNGVDIVYPPQNAELMDNITRHGCVISQFPMGVKPAKGHFPYRNRIISGMTLGTLVVEAPPDSGALITARNAAEQGREVFAVPGQIGVRNSEGPHALIREGAKLVETVEDIVLELDLPAPCRQTPRQEVQTTLSASTATGPTTDAKPDARSTVAPTPESRRDARSIAAPSAAGPQRDGCTTMELDILSVLSPNGSFVDEIAAACRIPVSEALSSLTLLELKGLVRQFSGKRFAPA
ncbi:MAG TPA: DNA-processing protein DprA [Candidatus Bathyarchaeia archaeon]|nr:DNA-processing protein DprA [Candidatus Bathyarchaeia archaeon]